MVEVRVAVPCSGLGHVKRGAEVWAKELAYSLNERGVNVTLYKGGGRAETEIERVLPCVRRDSLLLGGRRSPISWYFRLNVEDWTFNLFLARYADQFDIVHTGGLGTVSALTRRHGLPNVVYVNLGGHVEELRHIRNVQVQAPYYMHEARRLGIDISHWFCIPSFVDTTRFAPQKSSLRQRLGLSDETFVVLSVGAISKRHKRMDWLIKEFARFRTKRRNSHLLIVGQSEDETSEVVSLGRNLLGDAVTFLRDIPHCQMPQLYPAADVFVLASIREAFGITFLEAMASQVPALGHNFAVTKWVIGEGGQTLDMTRDGELSRVLNEYVDSQRKHIDGNNGRERTKTVFSKQAVTTKIIEMYEEIVE